MPSLNGLRHGYRAAPDDSRANGLRVPLSHAPAPCNGSPSLGIPTTKETVDLQTCSRYPRSFRVVSLPARDRQPHNKELPCVFCLLHFLGPLRVGISRARQTFGAFLQAVVELSSCRHSMGESPSWDVHDSQGVMAGA